MTLIATTFCLLVILSLFALDRDRHERTSKALWIPTLWILIAASRMVSGWLQTGPQTLTPDQYLDGSPLDRFVLSALLALAVTVLLCRSRRVREILGANWPILLFFAYCAVSTLWSAYPDVAFKRWIKSMGDLAMVLIIVTDRDSYAAIKRVLSRVTFLLVPLSVLFIEYYPRLGRVYSAEDATTVFTGVTMNKNTLGRLCLVLGLATVWRLVSLLRNHPRRTKQWLAHGTVLAMILWLLYMANSATSTACFLLGAAVIVFINLPGKSQPARAPLLVAGLVSVAMLVWVVPDVYASLVHAMGRNTTLTDRTKLWAVLLDMKTDPWIGTGFTSFWLGDRLDKIWSLYWWKPNEAHNGYLGVYLNLGWIGLGMLGVLLAAGYRNVVAALRRNPEEGSLRLGFLVVALVYNITESGFRMMIPVWIFLLWAIIRLPESPVDEVVADEEEAGAVVVQEEEAIPEICIYEERV